MQAVILAGGKGNQLHSSAANILKPMASVFDRPVLEHTIRLLVKHGITDISITISHLTKNIMQYFGDGSRWEAHIKYSVENEPLGTAGAVKLLQNMIDDTFVVVSGDVVTDIDFTTAIEQHKSSSATASIMLHRVDDAIQYGAVQQDKSGRITKFLEKPKTTEIFSNTVSTGIYILEPEVLSCIPYNQAYDFGRHLFPRMLNNQEPVYGFDLPGYWCDIGDLIQYRNCHFDALQGKLKLDIPATYVGEGIWLGEGTSIDPSVELSSPIYVGKGASVRHGAVLGKYTIIGAGALVDEGVHITKSIIGSRSFVSRETKITNDIIECGCSITDSENIYDYNLMTDAKPKLPPTAQLHIQPELKTPADIPQQKTRIHQRAA